MRNPTTPDHFLLPHLLLVDAGDADQLSPNQLFTLVERGWIIFGVCGDPEGGIILSTTLTRLGEREAELYRKKIGLPPPTPDE
jgi:hypothetical protein